VPTRSFLFFKTPNWTINRPGTRHDLPLPVQSWTYEPHSLTQRLRDCYGNGVAVKILFQHWQKPFLTESQRLLLPNQRYSLIREVLLHIDNTPLILARTILPQTTINIAKRHLSHLGTRPLGEVIFSYPNLERLEMEICLVSGQHWSDALKHQIQLEPQVWGRRTVYAIEKQPMLVSEFFMPAALDAV
jgi:chorismate--pyruvate lyase